VGWAEVSDQGLACLVLQLLKSGSADLDRQGFGLCFQVAGAFRQNAEHNLSHARVSLSFRLHPWSAEAFCQVRSDTGNRPWRNMPLQRVAELWRPVDAGDAS
jgi:hypothetical protein